MESKWRENVVEGGIAWGKPRLAARLLAFPNFAVTDEVQLGPPVSHRFYNAADMQLWTPTVFALDPVPGSNFPYGWVVEPDHS